MKLIDDIVYEMALTFTHEELARMYAIALQREEAFKDSDKLLSDLLEQRENEILKLKKENAKLKENIERTKDTANAFLKTNKRLSKENAKLKEDYLKLNTAVQKELTSSTHSIWGLNKEYLKPVQEDYKDSRIIALGLFNKMINKEEWILKIDGLTECEVFATSEEAISFAKKLIDNEFQYE